MSTEIFPAKVCYEEDRSSAEIYWLLNDLDNKGHQYLCFISLSYFPQPPRTPSPTDLMYLRNRAINRATPATGMPEVRKKLSGLFFLQVMHYV